MGYGAGMTGKEAADDDEPDSNIPMNEIHVLSDEVYMPDERSSSPDGKFLYCLCYVLTMLLLLITYKHRRRN